MKAKIWSRKSFSERKLPRLRSLRTKILSQISTWFIKACVLGRVVQHHLVGGVVQKGRAAFHRVQDAAFALDAQCLCCDPFSPGHTPHSPGRSFRLGAHRVPQLTSSGSGAVEGPLFEQACGMPRRNLLHNASRFQFISDLPPGPLTDGPSRLGGSLTRQCRHLTALLAAKLR